VRSEGERSEWAVVTQSTKKQRLSPKGKRSPWYPSNVVHQTHYVSMYLQPRTMHHNQRKILSGISRKEGVK